MMPTRKTRDKDFLLHLNAYLDDTLKISKCDTKIILSSSLLPKTPPLHRHLKSFESSVGLSGKDMNTLRASHLDSKQDLILSLITYGSEGIYYFIKHHHSCVLLKISVWVEFFGYIGSVNLKIGDLRRLWEDKMRASRSRRHGD
ncbi:hypothetical protein BT93_F1520 [Corymbia citriodora subsp. variegata]|nr:hypothetical protein BT93_F1520 [Corymbia citriodora subsp. variegata]